MFKTKGGWSQRLFVKKETAELISWGIPPTLTNSKLPLSPKMIGKNLCDISGTEWPRHYQKNPICIAFHSFSTIFSYKWARNTLMFSMKSMFWTNEKLILIVAWSSSVSISRFRIQSSIFHLVCFFDSRNSIVSRANFWCPCIEYASLDRVKDWTPLRLPWKLCFRKMFDRDILFRSARTSWNTFVS